MLRYRKWRPSGSSAGESCCTSPLAVSSLVTGCGVPPDDGTTWMADDGPGANRMRLSLPHALMRNPASATVSGVPSDRRTALSRPEATNPMDSESGDQNGKDPPSVCGTG
jgi:hypothetical protein